MTDKAVACNPKTRDKGDLPYAAPGFFASNSSRYTEGPATLWRRLKLSTTGLIFRLAPFADIRVSMPAKNQKAAVPTSSRSASAHAVAASQPLSKKRKMGGAEKKYYAVRFGKKPGVYTDWTECQEQISGFKGAICSYHFTLLTRSFCALLTPPAVKSFPSREDASAFVAGRDPPSTSKPEPVRFYGVAVGREPGVYTDWPKVQNAIVGWKGPKYKRFDTRAEAEAYVRTYASADSIAVQEETADEADEQPPAKKTKKTAGAASSSNRSVLTIYTDGSSRGNGKLGAAAGVGVYFGPSDPRYVMYPIWKLASSPELLTQYLAGISRSALKARSKQIRERNSLPSSAPSR